MRLNEFVSEKEKQKLDEILPVLAVGAGMLARGAAAAGGAALRGGSALAKAAGSALSKGASSAGTAISKAASSAGTAISKGASSAGKALGGVPATPTGAAAAGAARAAQAAPAAAPGAMDIITALQDPKVAQQMKTMKQKMPDASLDAMVDPTADNEKNAQIQALDQALQALKKNAGLK